MKNNPFAKIFKQAFESDVINRSLTIPNQSIPERPERLQKFINNLNKFIVKSGEDAINTDYCIIDEKQVIEYANFLRGYMRDAQSVLKDINSQFAFDQDLLQLFKESSQYIVSCNNVVEGYKKIFKEDEAYRCWKLDNKQHDLTQASFIKQEAQANPKKKNLFLFMPFRIKENEKDLRDMFYKNMRESIDGNEFNDIDKYVAHFPIEKSRASKVYSTLKTIKEPDSYVEKEDIEFVAKHFLDFIGQDIKLDEKANVISGSKYNKEELLENFSNITIFGYCASTADAHRCTNVIKKVASQLYGDNVANNAMKNICVVSYGFLPIENSYSGAHFISNYGDSSGRIEPFAKLNNPELYEQVKYRQGITPAKVTTMPDKKNFVVAFKMTENNIIIEDNKIKPFIDVENGHNIANITSSKTLSSFAHKQFSTVLKNATLGKRGRDLFTRTTDSNLPNSNIMLLPVQIKSSIRGI